MRKENASFNTKFISESGSYLVNSDYFAFVELKDYACYCIADGIDTDERKESAKLAITTVITRFSENPGMSAGKLKGYMKAAHKMLLEEAGEMRLEASIVILLTDYKKAMWAHAGNSRLYWMKNGSIRAMTKDTSLTQKMVEDEEIPIDQLAFHEERNNLYSYLGQPGRLTPIISGKKKLEDGDILVMMTRGVWENVGEAELIDAVDGVSKAEDVCTGLEDVILSQRLEVVENYTIATIFVDKIYNNPNAGKRKKWIKLGVSIGAAVFAIVFGMLMMRYQTNKKSIAEMEKAKVKGIEYLQENNYTSAQEQFAEAYEASENVKAGEHSKNYQKVACIERYDKMAENLQLAEDALESAEYKKAAGLYASAVDIATTLQEEYGEDSSVYIDGMKQYHIFASNMVDGTNKASSGEYDAAITCFTSASESMNVVDDTTNKTTADTALKNTNAQKAMQDGIAFERKGEELLDDGVYSQALVQYQSAKEMYELARDSYGSTDATDKLSMVGVKISNIEGMMNKLSTQDLEKEADGYLKLASEASHNGKYEEAQEYYEAAKEIFQQTGNTDQIISINDKLENVQYGPDEDAAMDIIMSGLEAMAGGDYQTAIVYLQQAKQAYGELGDNVRVSKLEVIIAKAQNMVAAQ